MLVLAQTESTILRVVKLDTLTLGEGDPWATVLTNNHNVLKASSEGFILGILNVDNLV